MKFLCLGYLNVAEFDGQPDEVKNTVMKSCMEQCIPFRETGKILIETGLADVKTAKSIRPKRGQPSFTDGPFVETKEQLGSFFVVEAEDIDEAVKIASLHPAALLGEEYGFGIEVRQIMHDI
jgi:hypothetical protein